VQRGLIVTAFIMLSFLPLFADTKEEASAALNVELENEFYMTFNYGASASWLTRIIDQSGRSNFVFNDFLPGLYFNAELQNVPHFTPAARIAAFYPLISTFNNVPQKSNTPLHFAIDLVAGIRFKMEWNIFRFSAGPGLHMFFMSADRWNYLNMGIAAAAGFELALTPGWTLLIDGFASLDNGNLGMNQRMEPFSITYQYQVCVGIRYSKKMVNSTALFMPIDEEMVITIDR